MSTVFISYSHTDSNVADAIVKELEDLGINHFRDVKEIEWGQAISARVREGLHSASAIIVIVSPGSLKSQWVAYEIGFGSGTNKRILPYLTHGSLDLPAFISDLSYVKSVDKIREFFVNNPDWHETQTPKEAENEVHTFKLTEMQIEYLKTMSKPRNEGHIAGWVEQQTGRENAPYREAIEVFRRWGLVDYSENGYLFTSRAWKLVDQLWALSIADVLEVDKAIDDSVIAEKVDLTDGQVELDELRRHLIEMESHGFVKVTKTRGSWVVVLTHAGVTYRKHRPLSI